MAESQPFRPPHAGEDRVLSVVAGETQYRWAVHDGVQYYPVICWRTSAIAPEEIEKWLPCELLSKYLPAEALDFIFGKEKSPDRATMERASLYRATQRVPAISIYCIVPNEHHNKSFLEKETAKNNPEKHLGYMFSEIPCNFYKLEAIDLCDSLIGDSHNNGVPRHSIEQLSTLKAADLMFPDRRCLIIDGGTTLSFTATVPKEKSGGGEDDTKKQACSPSSTKDAPPEAAAPEASSGGDPKLLSDPTKEEPAEAKEAIVRGDKKELLSDSGGSDYTIPRFDSTRIVGDCQTVSITSKLRALHKNTGALPEIDTKRVQICVHNLLQKQQGLALFATNTEDAMVGCVLRETILFLQSVVKSWAFSGMANNDGTSVQQKNGTDDGPKRARIPLVCFTGMEAQILNELLVSSDGTSCAVERVEDPSLSWFPQSKDIPKDSKVLQIRQTNPVTGADQIAIVEVRTERHLVHHGVQRALTLGSLARKLFITPDEKLRQELIGCRVAKEFTVDGETSIYRGQVMSVNSSRGGGTPSAPVDKDDFLVRYDDGDEYPYTTPQLYGECSRLA